jgi:FtsH-binding integral membrane protein
MKFSRIEAVITLSLLSFFLFNNMAPPYDGWQMRGEWIARLYQPFFVVMVSYIARLYASSPKDSTSSRLTLLGCLIAFTFNAIVVFGPVTGIGPADRVYHNFYQHSPTPYRLYDNLRKYGKRPLGFCRKG